MASRRQFLSGFGGVAFCAACGMRPAWGQGAAPRRKVSVGGRAVRTVDIHCHCVVPEMMDVLSGTPLEKQARATINSPTNNPSMKDRLATMDAQGIDVEAMSINAFWYGADRDTSRRLIDLLNQKMAHMCQQAPDRFVGFGAVALQFPELAAEQLEAAMKQHGLKGAAIGGSVNDKELSDPMFDPFWKKAEELQAVIFMHPQSAEIVTGIDRRVQGNGMLRNVIGNPLETTIALSHMIFEGTLDRFPGLKICAAHGGGYLPSYADRSDNGCRTLKQCSGLIRKRRQPNISRISMSTRWYSRRKRCAIWRRSSARGGSWWAPTTASRG
ncbi:MAG TPA: amidohydrolase family protein [Beijerinckiaceae bacterium]|jgi:aminocarboxymuconate-semialdehyde decarboxylase|nr:amidohydrolase family protein [Beijerinckiaceae bacterium]